MKSGLKVKATRKLLACEDVALHAAMKSGLKALLFQVRHEVASVALHAAMKSGLKELFRIRCGGGEISCTPCRDEKRTESSI